MKPVRWLCLCMALILLLSAVPVAKATEDPSTDVQQVIELLEQIDTLQQIQDMRDSFQTTAGHYDVNTTNPSVAEKHESKRAAYEAYVSEMFAMRTAAQNAYDALTDSQKQQIPQELVAKLNNTLPTVFNAQTLSVTPSNDEYHFEAVNGGGGYGYEVSNYMVSGQIPQTFILVDTSDGKTTWTPDGFYQPGSSNYEVLYCCDVETPMAYSSDYRRLNLEDSSYFSKASADHIRGILTNCYPYISLEEMKSRLRASGVAEDFVDSLTRSDAISAAQMAVWVYANAISDDDGYGYFASVDIKRNTGYYFTPLHDHTNEVWEWLPQARKRSYDARAEYRVNMLAYFLCQLPPVSASESTALATKMEVMRALVEPNADGTYRVGVYVTLPSGGSSEDRLEVTMTSYQLNPDGSRTAVDKDYRLAGGASQLSLSVNAWPGNEIEITLDGEQVAPKGVYFYEARGGRDVSQSLVGVSMGSTQVHDVETFTFDEIGQMGLRIYKSVRDSKKPISDIVFNIYHVEPGEGEEVGSIPSLTDMAKYAIPENLVGSLVTDNTGYAAMTLPEGIYLVEEEPTPKVKAPVEPFFVRVPMIITTELEDGTVEVETIYIPSVYPKNEPPDVPPPPPPPPPSRVEGRFAISKYDEADSSMKLEGARFAVYTAAKGDEANAEKVTVNGIEHLLLPVMVDGQHLVLETDANGYALSPDLECTTYLLLEIQAPRGYLPKEELISVTVQPDTVQDIALVEISNTRGFRLPETGGMGTALYTGLGLVLVVAALTLLVWKKRCQYCE